MIETKGNSIKVTDTRVQLDQLPDRKYPTIWIKLSDMDSVEKGSTATDHWIVVMKDGSRISILESALDLHFAIEAMIDADLMADD